MRRRRSLPLPTPNAGTSKASQAYWSVADVEAEVADLKSRGVKFEDYNMPGIKMTNNIATGGGAKTAWFKTRRQHPSRKPAPYVAAPLRPALLSLEFAELIRPSCS